MYDFKTVVRRDAQGSSKWKLMTQHNNHLDPSIVPLSVADTDMVMAPEIVQGLKDYLEVMVLGYTGLTQSYYDAVIGWFKKRHNWDVEASWIVESPGVVNALFNLVAAFTKVNEGVIIMPPVYYPFRSSIEKQDRVVVENELIYKDHGYSINFEDLLEKAQDPNNTLLILCSPHNPVGRVWTKEELTKIAEICYDNNVLVISDEIHFDLILPGFKHTVFSQVSDKAYKNSIIATAPSKTFNLAGLQTSNLVIANPELKATFKQYMDKTPFHALNAIGPKACEIAYTQCDAWLEEFLALIETNRRVFKEFIESKIPAIKVIELQGTYLQWFDCTELGYDDETLNKILIDTCNLYLDAGNLFGASGTQFQRINIACPTHVLQDALIRLEEGIR